MLSATNYSLQIFQSSIVFSLGIEVLGLRDHLFVLFLYSIWLMGPPSRASSHRFYSDVVITTTVAEIKRHQVSGFAVTKCTEMLFNFSLGNCQKTKLPARNIRKVINLS